MCTCEEALELISASLDGVLSKEEEQLLHEHLSQCPACRDLLADLEGIHESMPGLWVDPPSDLKDHIMERIQSSTVSPMPAGTSKRRWKGWAALAAVCAVAVLGAGSLKYLGLGGGSSGAAAPPAAMSAGGAAMDAAPQEMPEAASVPASSDVLADRNPRSAEDGVGLNGSVSRDGSTGESSASSKETGGGTGEPALSAVPEDTGESEIQPGMMTASLLLPERQALDLVYQALGGEESYTSAPLPNEALTGLLLQRADGAFESVFAYAALIYTGSTPVDGAQDDLYCYTFHLHTYTSEDFSPDARDAAYTVYTVWPGGTVESLQEGEPVSDAGLEPEEIEQLQEKYGLTAPGCGEAVCDAILGQTD